MNGGAFLLGALAGAMARQRADRQAGQTAHSYQAALADHDTARADEETARRLEDAANAQPVSPIQPPMPIASKVTATGGQFALGVPEGFGSLPPPLLERWIASTGPSLATVADLNAEGVGVSMLISANDRGSVEPEQERGFWRLSHDLRDEVARRCARMQLSLTHGPQAILVDGARAICYAATGRHGVTEVRNWSALIIKHGGVVEITMNVQPHVEERYLPVWWTVLGSWVWMDRETDAPQEHAVHQEKAAGKQALNIGEGWDVVPPS